MANVNPIKFELCTKIQEEATEPNLVDFALIFPHLSKSQNKHDPLDNNHTPLQKHLLAREKINCICEKIKHELDPKEIEILAKLLPALVN
ncbi:hypothetical protein M0813_12842 [Anaeramoeba flamelloides]|uniref:Uncharacterized protein n=1 Tax=Anaeramoeba flamelloides TaxID=1746091 RepID=A0ABQ8ZAQ8_9EUKA|nr:hypothetical protein M0813_12842 [Anaeramoeba flamelloides]